MTSTGHGCLHAALLHGSADELAATAVPFLADGLAAGEAAVLACREDHGALLAEALGNDDRILFLHREGIYTRGAHAIATYRRMVRHQVAAGAPRVRLIGEVPVDLRPQGWAEWHRYEAVFDAALAPLPLSSVCAYDTRELPGPIRDGVEQTHAALLTPGGLVPNGRHVDPATVLRRIAADPAERLDDGPVALHLADLVDVSRLPELRAQLRAALDGLRGQQQRLRDEFLTAIGEVLGNAFRHGRPPVAVRLWLRPTQLVCTVTDHGEGFDDPLAGYGPPGNGSPPAGAGLWLVRRTCDTLEVIRSVTGFAVRLTTSLPGSDPVPVSVSRPVHDEPSAARADRARAHARDVARRLHSRT